MESPYLSSLEFKNVGAKPISTADYETGISISISPKVQIVTARISTTKPVDLNPRLKIESNKIAIEPLLLNPNDSISLAVISSGPPPVYSAHGRIAGISRIEVLDESRKSPRWFNTALLIVVAIVGQAAYFIYAIAAIRPGTVTLTRGLAVSTMLSSGALSAHVFNRVLDTYGSEPTLAARWPAAALILVIAIIVARKFTPKRQRLRGASIDG